MWRTTCAVPELIIARRITAQKLLVTMFSGKMLPLFNSHQSVTNYLEFHVLFSSISKEEKFI